MKLSLKKLLLLLCVLFSFSACYYDNFEELHPNIVDVNCDTTGTISYANDIVPILTANCGLNNSCHDAVADDSGIPLVTYDDVEANAASIVRSIKHDPSIATTRWMPNGGGMLSSCDISKIDAWVNRGRLNN